MSTIRLYPKRPLQAIEEASPLPYDSECNKCTLCEGTKRVAKGAGTVGGLLIVGERPSLADESAGQLFCGPGGTFVKSLIRKSWSGPVFADVATRCYAGGRLPDDKHIAACRSYLAQTIQTVKPTKIFALGQKAILALTGRNISPITIRRGYAWIQIDGNPVPIFYLQSELEAASNWVVRKYLAEDFEWACKAKFPPPNWSAVATTVDTEQTAIEAVEDLCSTEYGFAFDLEWAGFQFSKELRPLCLSACAVGGSGKVWLWDEIALTTPSVFAPMKAALEDANQPKGGANVKSDMHTLLSISTAVRGITFDTRIMRKLIDTDGSGYLEDLQELIGMGGGKERMHSLVDEACAMIRKEATRAQKEAASKQAMLGFDTPTRSVQAARKMGFDFSKYMVEPKTIAYAFVPSEELTKYNCIDSLSTARGAAQLISRLSSSQELQGIWDKVVMPASRAIARVEEWGVPLDVGYTEVFQQYIDAQIKTSLDTIKSFGEFDVESPLQLGKLLFGKLGLPVGNLTETGQPQVNEDELTRLSKLGHALPGHILNFRHFKKLKGYTSDWLYRVQSDGRIHPGLHQDGARCLPKGELVLTSRGYLPVEQIVIGDLVLTHKGRAKAVNEIITNPPSPIYRITLQSGLQLRCTGGHKFLIGDSWVRADSLSIGDVCTTHSGVELWKPISGWPYFVSSWGRVKSALGTMRQQHRKYPKTAQGHLKVSLSRQDGKRSSGNKKDFAIHRLVLEAFGSAPLQEQTECRHLNGLPWDNTIANLRWGTAAENRRDAVLHGADFAPHNRRLTAEDVALIRAAPRKPHGGVGTHSKDGVSDSTLAAHFGVSREMVRDIKSGKRWLDPRPPNERAEDRRAYFQTSPITSISTESPEVNYGLVVDDDHSHVTAGIVTHNSGRLSSSRPNLQNVSSEKRDPVDGKRSRDCFAAPPGCVFIQADFSQLELRIACELSDDDAMRDLFRSGIDFHLGTAKLISKIAWGISPDDVGTPHRLSAKTFNFGLLYGKTDGSLAEELGIEKEAAQQIRFAIFGAFKNLGKWVTRVTNEAKQIGGCWTYWEGKRARWRPLVNIGDDSKARRGFYINALNSAVNSPVQGTGSDVCLAALTKCVQTIERGEMDAQLILPIHDSLMFLVPENKVAEVAQQVRSIMTSWPWCKTPLEVDVDVGNRWGSLVKMK